MKNFRIVLFVSSAVLLSLSGCVFFDMLFGKPVPEGGDAGKSGGLIDVVAGTGIFGPLGGLLLGAANVWQLLRGRAWKSAAVTTAQTLEGYFAQNPEAKDKLVKLLSESHDKAGILKFVEKRLMPNV